MKEFILLFRNQTGNDGYILSPDEMKATMPKWESWIGEIIQKGKFVATQPLDYEGKVLRNTGVTDGPYVEVKEILAGYLICKAESLDEALEIGKKCPILDYEHGSLEVRPITPFTI